MRRPAPESFAGNANLLLAEAKSRGADLFLMNNDLVFTPGWLGPMTADRRALLSPLSNAQLTRHAGTFTTQPLMDLTDYIGYESNVETIGRQHGTESQGYTAVASLAFFCIKIPAAVYSEIGTLRRAVRQRAAARTATTPSARGSRAFRRSSRSAPGSCTSRASRPGAAPRPPEQQAQRDTVYTQAFQAKWGAALTYAFIGGDWNLFRADGALAAQLDAHDYPSIVRHLHRHRSLDTYIERQQQARVDAVCCIYDDDSWLAPAIASIYDACDGIWFLVGERPWNGLATDQRELLARIDALPDPQKKVRVVRGDWPEERRSAMLACSSCATTVATTASSSTPTRSTIGAAPSGADAGAAESAGGLLAGVVPHLLEVGTAIGSSRPRRSPPRCSCVSAPASSRTNRTFAAPIARRARPRAAVFPP